MPDDIDLAQERDLIATADAVRKASRDIPPGQPGECDFCEDHFARLVDGLCARCRDKYRGGK